MKITIKFFILIFCWAHDSNAISQSSPPNLIVITADGLRWQEIFNGTDDKLLSYLPNDQMTLVQNQGTQSREVLMPFVWNTFSHYANLFGNRNHENYVNTRNYHRFSYPGYSEIFCGVFDPFVDSNNKNYNKNVTVLEELNQHYNYKNHVAVFSSWEVFPYIFNAPRSRIMVNAGWSQINVGMITPEISRLNNLIAKLNSTKEETRHDHLTWQMALEYAKANHPKVLYISSDETDHYGHKADYVSYIKAITRFDQFLSSVWDLIQSDSFYKDNTYLLITTDHGRGSTTSTWRNHGLLPVRSGETWYMEYGPGIQAKGEIVTPMQKFQASLAYKMADYLDFKFVAHKLPLTIERPSEALLVSSKQ